MCLASESYSLIVVKKLSKWRTFCFAKFMLKLLHKFILFELQVQLFVNTHLSRVFTIFFLIFMRNFFKCHTRKKSMKLFIYLLISSTLRSLFACWFRIKLSFFFFCKNVLSFKYNLLTFFSFVKGMRIGMVMVVEIKVMQ